MAAAVTEKGARVASEQKSALLSDGGEEEKSAYPESTQRVTLCGNVERINEADSASCGGGYT